MNVQIMLFEGFDLLDVVAPYEVFSAANQFTEEEIDVRFVSVDGGGDVLSGINDFPFKVEGKLDASKKGIVLVPGSSGSMVDGEADSIPMKLKKASETEMGDFIRNAVNDPEMTVTSVCGGSLLIAMTGSIEGRNVVTHHMGMDLLSATGANAVNARVVDDGDIISGAGVTSGLDLAIYVVERELGPRIAYEVEQLFQYEKRGIVWKNEGALPMGYNSSKRNDEELTVTETHESHPLQEEIEGTWEVTISTPIGEIDVTYELEIKDNKLIGIAVTDGDQSELEKTEAIGNRLKWKQQVKKPMKINLNFDVSINGTTLEGQAKAGMISSKLKGSKVFNKGAV
ncbi:DJ-1/PfpI family protein [Halobacillus litoralis]|uniref:DJ-1/PfpI family protein n=1 Tax=Halobacillus litoralis TaxID=45668 RepID=A0A410ME48_9BACI|nr:DJ-1/PfpI family protein [Halobacillus litoralis]QAS52935.1 DJ-1/PfpI family protein [Halobacillus litoralis]